jgi:uncharacterized protein YcbX
MLTWGGRPSATEVTVKVTEICKYPVKTMAGEKLPRRRLGPLGIDSDRIVHVDDARERVITAPIRGPWAISVC